MTDDKRNQGQGGQAQQGQQQNQQNQQQGQFGQPLQSDRQQSQSRANETDSQQNIWGEGSGSNQQAQAAHRDRMERLQSSQRTGGVAEENQQLRQAGSVPRVPRQAQAVQGIADQNAPFATQQGQQQNQTQEVNADREQHVRGQDLGTSGQRAQGGQTQPTESGERGAMYQTSLAPGFKSNRTWTQTSGGQQATQTSLQGGQWPAQAQGQSEGQNQGQGVPQQQEPSQARGPGKEQQQGQARWQDPEQMLDKNPDQRAAQNPGYTQGQQNQSQSQGEDQAQSGRQTLQQNQPEVRYSTTDLREQMRQDAWENRDSQGRHPEEGSHQQHFATSRGDIEDAGTRKQQNQAARSQESGEMLEQRRGLRGETDDRAGVEQRSQGQAAPNIDQQQRQGGAGGQDPDRQPGSGGQRAEAVADRIQDDDLGDPRKGGGGTASRRRS